LLLNSLINPISWFKLPPQRPPQQKSRTKEKSFNLLCFSISNFTQLGFFKLSNSQKNAQSFSKSTSPLSVNALSEIKKYLSMFLFTQSTPIFTLFSSPCFKIMSGSASFFILSLVQI